MLSAVAAPDPAHLERIRLEARAAAGLQHPHIVEIYDYGEVPGLPGELPVPYVVMELVEGRTLTEVLADGPLPWHAAVRICAQVAAALAAAHASNIVHRDVKPGNIMVTSDGIKLVDFGISAAVGSADETGGELLGTPAYLAPERLDGGPVRPATDVYGLGLLLYRALAGRMPWQATTVTEMVRAHLNAEPAPLPAINGLPRVVTDVLRRCLAKLPGDRPTADEVAQTLGEACGLLPRVPRQTSRGSRKGSPPRFRRWKAQDASAAVAMPRSTYAMHARSTTQAVSVEAAGSASRAGSTTKIMPVVAVACAALQRGHLNEPDGTRVLGESDGTHRTHLLRDAERSGADGTHRTHLLRDAERSGWDGMRELTKTGQQKLSALPAKAASDGRGGSRERSGVRVRAGSVRRAAVGAAAASLALAAALLFVPLASSAAVGGSGRGGTVGRSVR
ncbi:hypothetical protein GCM10010435_28470 [Winogradskya consettensis]|uniref:non-specific serine/threonine protein kinase n=1 Tax=Winogradskya consettensis TaxID=113560 RepID=A0A919VP57_9ACTN|nr:hypothetical protein Aco04nite_23040 [Actinoplanes consettensis]